MTLISPDTIPSATSLASQNHRSRPSAEKHLTWADSIRLARPDDISALADTHAEALPNDFLVRLGKNFLRHVFFPTLLDSPRTRIHVAELDGQVMGFLVTRVGLGGILGETVARHPLRLAGTCVAAMIRAPRLFVDAFSVLAQLRMRASQAEANGVAELFLMAVAENARRRGVGRALIHASIKELESAGIRSYRVLLHADNVPADRLYDRAGFAERATYRFAGQIWRERHVALG